MALETAHHNHKYNNRLVVLDQLPGGENIDDDQLFLLPDSILAMDSISFREDVAAVAPSFLPPQNQNSPPHNSLDSTDSSRSLKLQDDTEGIKLVRASNGCRTLWLCKYLSFH